MKPLRLVVFVAAALMLVVLPGCVSLDRYDEWRQDAYEPEKKELEAFEQLAAEYENAILFDSAEDQAAVRGVSGSGVVEAGVYRFAHESDSEYAHFHIELGYLQAQNGEDLERIAFLAKARNRGSGFVEVYPGGDIADSGANNPNSVESDNGLADRSWTLVEFIADGDRTLVKGTGYEAVMERRLESLSLFCFNGAAVELDYILFD
jgi:hypothetical protein